MQHDVIVLGGGIVGVCVAIHLQRRGRSVLLVDRRRPGRETSFGNGGIIQSEGVRPFRFPRDWRTLAGIASGRNPGVRYDPAALLRNAGALHQYWRNSGAVRYAAIARDYSSLIAHAVNEHRDLIADIGAEHLLVDNGWIKFFRSPRSWEGAVAEAELITRDFGLPHDLLSSAMLRTIEPALHVDVAGAIRWPNSPTINDPGKLMSAFTTLLLRSGGRIVAGDAWSLDNSGDAGWSVATCDGVSTAREVVIALGPWSAGLTRRLGYRFPLFVKRGYHQHFGVGDGAKLKNWLVDADAGWLLAPMASGIRLATGAEFADIDRSWRLDQLHEAEQSVRAVFPLGERLTEQPTWMGARPCTSDMKPIIGKAPRHAGLWFAFGHAHHGFTLGPATGRLLAEQMTGEDSMVNPAPFSPDRFR